MSVLPDDDRFPALMADAAARDARLGAIDWRVLPAQSERDVLRAPSGDLARVRLGPVDGPRVLLVPGMTGSKEDFTLTMPGLAAAGYRAESYDLAGQYESHAAGPEQLDPAQHRYTLGLFVDDLLAALRDGPTPVHVLGYSFAATVAIEAATRHPELFASLTLLSAPPRAGDSLRDFKVLGPLSRFVPGHALTGVFVAALRWNVIGAPAERASFVAGRLDLTRRSSVGDILDLMQHTPDRVAALRDSGIPLLVVGGTGDVWHVATHRAYAAALGARLVVLHSGHGPCETAPNQLTEAMLSLFRASPHRA
ncbi:MAG TPA: alpha/beta fold hydrolase [Microbacterium sp.]|uniref:alpha/beta fold hydrolase n=1 Tax=Microbacterium sp. TaxID=51671 RepID=UPI002B48D09E|nr:alpha/beta fold hydrolase [Microbacterium sp.]HKT57222.1 alpha/beta fold hydrolase [Microbacterium sp.]